MVCNPILIFRRQRKLASNQHNKFLTENYFILSGLSIWYSTIPKARACKLRSVQSKGSAQLLVLASTGVPGVRK